MDRPARVVITGVGAVTPIGNTAEEFWAALIQGASGIGPITRFDATGFPTRIAGELKGFEPLKYIDKKDDRKFDPFLKYAIACAVMAVEDAGLDLEQVDKTRFGVLVGSGIGGITTLLDTHDVLNAKGPDRVSPFFIPMLIINMASGLISMRFGDELTQREIGQRLGVSQMQVSRLLRRVLDTLESGLVGAWGDGTKP